MVKHFCDICGKETAEADLYSLTLCTFNYKSDSKGHFESFTGYKTNKKMDDCIGCARRIYTMTYEAREISSK